MRTSANYSFKLPEGTDNVKRQDLVDNFESIDTNMKAIATQSSEWMNILIPKSGSAANAILLDVTTFTSNKKYSFKSTSTSTGNVTINSKAFKKLDGTQIGSGGVKANKVYDFYYDGTADCVFILAKAVGTATVADVLAPKTFSNGDDIELTGTIPSKAVATYSPSTNVQTISAGQYLSGVQTISAITGTATKADVVAGKTFNSANGIGLIGEATIQSIGGKKIYSVMGAVSTLTASFKETGNTVSNQALLNITGFNFIPVYAIIEPYYANQYHFPATTYAPDDGGMSTIGSYVYLKRDNVNMIVENGRLQIPICEADCTFNCYIFG